MSHLEIVEGQDLTRERPVVWKRYWDPVREPDVEAETEVTEADDPLPGPVGPSRG